ncbi:MAG: hypothetical protein ACXWJB_09400 [Limisphaerales bacterium]
MNLEAKKIQAAAQVEGEESQWYIKCDLDESKGHPFAVLFWSSSVDGRHAYCKLDPSHLAASDIEGVAYIYTGNPIPIPKTLAEMRPAPLSHDAERLGFFRIE